MISSLEPSNPFCFMLQMLPCFFQARLRSTLFVHPLIRLNCPLHRNILECCVSVMMESVSGRQLSSVVRGWDCYYAGTALWLQSADREASLTRQRRTSVRFVECSALWHAEIIRGNTFIATEGQLMWSHTLQRIPSMTYYRRTRQSVWYLLALCNGQLRGTFESILSSVEFSFWRWMLHSWIIYCEAALRGDEVHIGI